jgi:hypothetical protein
LEKTVLRVRNLLAVFVLMALALLGCGGDDGGGEARGSEGTFVGTAKGTNAYIALVSDGKRVAGYVCDGKKLSVWLEDRAISDGRVNLASRQGDLLGEVTLSDSVASGNVLLWGSSRGVDAVPAEGEAGLYRAAKGKPGKTGSVEVGWVVLNDGSQRGATSFIDPAADVVVKPAPQFIDPAAELNVNVGGKTVQLRPKKVIDPIFQ